MVIPSDSHGPHPPAYRCCIPEEPVFEIKFNDDRVAGAIGTRGKSFKAFKNRDDRQASCLRLI